MRMDVSFLFNSLGTNANNVSNTFNLGDYASLKNGSYKKLMKAYYSPTRKQELEEAASADKTKKNKNIDTTGLTQMKKEADSLKNAVEALGEEDLWKQTGGNYNMDKIAGAVKTFANEYNDVLDKASKVNSKEVTQSTYYMSNMTNTMSKALSKIGVNVGADGKLSVDEEALKKADAKTIKSMFAGNVSYGSQVADKASSISRATVMSASTYLSNGSLNSSFSNLFNTGI